jgi:hypothetical protein
MIARATILAGMLIVSLIEVGAQGTIVILKDSVKVKTDLVSTSDDQLVTKAGVFSLNEIFSIRFLNETEAEQRPLVVEKLLRRNIKVFIGERLVDSLPAESIPKKSESQSPITQTKPTSSSKEDPDPLTLPNIGIGLGVDYGGIGLRFSVPLEKHISVFLAGGYALSGLGYNLGSRIKFSPQKRVTMTTSIMYGYNAAIKVINASQYDKVYTGLSLGLGFETKSWSKPLNAFHAGFILPFRSDEFDTDFNFLKKNGISLSDPWPILITIGYHFSIKN